MTISRSARHNLIQNKYKWLTNVFRGNIKENISIKGL